MARNEMRELVGRSENSEFHPEYDGKSKERTKRREPKVEVV